MEYIISDKIKERLKRIKENLLNGESLHSFAIRHKYCHSALDLLSNQGLSFETQRELLEQSKGKTFQHLKDDRSIYEYDLNLIAGWVVEDYIVDNSSGLLQLNGSDKERNILLAAETIKNTSDLINPHNGMQIEVHTEYFMRLGEYTDATIKLRDNKYKHLKEDNAFLLVINIPSRTYLLKRVTDFQAKYEESNPKYGGKPVWDLSLDNISKEFKPLNYLFEIMKAKSTNI